MFCPNCGKTIDDNATFCGFCGAPTGAAASTPTAAPQPAQPVIPQNTVPQPAVPQPVAPQEAVPQPAAPQPVAPQPVPQQPAAPQPALQQPVAPQQYAAPQAPQAMQQPQYAQPQQPVSVSFSLDAKTTGIINKAISGALIILSILIIIGSIGCMAVAGSISNAIKTLDTSGLGSGNGVKAFYDLARVPAIIAFIISIGGLAFSILTKQRSLFAYVSAGAGLILFIFNFVMYGGYVSLVDSIYSLSFSLFSGIVGGVKIGGIIVAGIFLLIGALAMICSSLVIILNKEDIIKFKPKF